MRHRAGARLVALGMGWIDRHKRHGIVLALLALALQMVFAFDHVHLRGVAQHAITQRAVVHASSQAPAQIPADDDGYCAVCASIFLASTAFAPAAPPLPVPATFERVEHRLGVAAAFIENQRLAFRSRAPPKA